MKLSRAVQVHRAVCEAMEEAERFSFAHALCLAKKELDPHVRFFVEKETELIQKYGEPDETGNILDETGRFKLKKDEAEAFFREKAELDAVEVSVESVRVTVPPERIKGKALELLMEVLDFPSEEEAG